MEVSRHTTNLSESLDECYEDINQHITDLRNTGVHVSSIQVIEEENNRSPTSMRPLSETLYCVHYVLTREIMEQDL